MCFRARRSHPLSIPKMYLADFLFVGNAGHFDAEIDTVWLTSVCGKGLPEILVIQGSSSYVCQPDV